MQVQQIVTMNYKVIFSRNEITLCWPTGAQLPQNHGGDVFYQFDAEQKTLIYAIIQAESPEEADEKARELKELFRHSGNT